MSTSDRFCRSCGAAAPDGVNPPIDPVATTPTRGTTAVGAPPTEGGASKLVLLTAAALVAAAVVAGLLIAGSLGGRPPLAIDPPAAAGTAAARTPPTATVVAATVATDLCTAARALQDAQDDHMVPLATYISDAASGRPVSTGARATAQKHAEAIATTFLQWGPRVDGMKSTDLAPLIVATRNAYLGYGEGILTMKSYLDGSGGDLLVALQELKKGQTSLLEALSLLDLLNASGALDCPR